MLFNSVGTLLSVLSLIFFFPITSLSPPPLSLSIFLHFLPFPWLFPLSFHSPTPTPFFFPHSVSLSSPSRSLSLQPNYALQTDDHRAALLARYGPEKLFQAERNFNAAQDLDMSLLEGDLVGVIKQQDPMGSQNRWLIDNGGTEPPPPPLCC